MEGEKTSALEIWLLLPPWLGYSCRSERDSDSSDSDNDDRDSNDKDSNNSDSI